MVGDFFCLMLGKYTRNQSKTQIVMRASKAARDDQNLTPLDGKVKGIGHVAEHIIGGNLYDQAASEGVGEPADMEFIAVEDFAAEQLIPDR